MPVSVCADDAHRVEGLPFVRDFVRMCTDGYDMGWHERNGGNASYRLRAEEREAVLECLGLRARSIGFAPAVAGADDAAAEGLFGPWQPLSVDAPGLEGEWLLITATGSYMRNVAREPEQALGIVEIGGPLGPGNVTGTADGVAGTEKSASESAAAAADVDGGPGADSVVSCPSPTLSSGERSAEADAPVSFRVIWGFEDGGRPTSELSAHVLIHEVKKAASNGASRVLYHCHPTPIVALAHVLPHDARTVTRLLWKMMTECVMVFPEGIGVVPCEVPGSMELARQTAEQVRTHNAVMWAQHGLLATGETCDAAFGLLHVIVKSAEIYQTACIMAGGAQNARFIPDEELPRLAAGLGVTLNPDYC